MAIEIFERVTSRVIVTGKSPAATTNWVITGTSDEIAASTALSTGTPLTYPSMTVKRADMTVTPIGDPLLSEMWDGVVTYNEAGSPASGGGGGSNAPAVVGSQYFNFDTGSAQIHITQSLGTSQESAVNAPDFKRGINVSKDGTEGTDILGGEFRFSENHYFSAAAVNAAYIATLSAMSATTNDLPFRGYARNEVLFLNASGARRGTAAEDGWEITYNFAVKENIPAGFAISPDVIMPAIIDGWSYVWVTYGPSDQLIAGKKYKVQVPKFAYEETVYDDSDFSTLGIGVLPW